MTGRVKGRLCGRPRNPFSECDGSPYLASRLLSTTQDIAMYDLSLVPILDDSSVPDAPAAPAPAAAADDRELLDAYSRAVIDVVDRLGPAVVRLDVRTRAESRHAGSGSGVVVAPDGLVLTNSHVVGGAKSIDITTVDGRNLTAHVVGDDPDTDLALVRADAAVTLPSARLGDSKQLKRGQLALVSSRGEVVGINTAVIMGAQGICFAVASNTASFVLGELVRHGRVRRAFIGVSAQQTAIPRRLQVAAGLDQATATMVTTIERDSPADRAGLMTGDMVVALDGHKVTGADDLIRLLGGERIGRAVEIEVLRLGRKRSFSLVPEERRRTK